MTGTSKKLFSSLLALALVLGLFAAMPMTAKAAGNSDSDTIDVEDLVLNGAVGDNLSFANWSYDATTSTITVIDDVNVIGTKIGGFLLYINIAPGKTVAWEATYSSTSASVVSVSGSGRFDVAASGSITSSGGVATSVLYASSSVVVNVSSGEISTSGSGTAITGDNSSSISVSGGMVSAHGNNPTILATGNVEVSGAGKVENTGSGRAINATGAGASVTINGGTVSSTSGTAIGSDGAVNVSGGSITASGNETIYTGSPATVTVSGGTVSNTGTGYAIFAGGNATVSNGAVSAATGIAVYAANTVTVGGGTVKTEGITDGIQASNSNVILSGGTVVSPDITSSSGSVQNGAAALLYPVTITGLPNGTYANPVAQTSGFMMDSSKAANTGYNQAWMPVAASQTYTVTASNGNRYTATGAISAAVANTLAFTLVPGSGGGGIGWIPPNPTSPSTTPPPPTSPFPAGGEAAKRINVYKYEKLKTTLFRLNKGDAFTVLGLANGGKALLIEHEDGRQGYIALKDIGVMFGSPLRATALKKAAAYIMQENGKLKRSGYFAKGQLLSIHGIVGKYLICRQTNATYYLDAGQWVLAEAPAVRD